MRNLFMTEIIIELDYSHGVMHLTSLEEANGDVPLDGVAFLIELLE